MRRSGGHEHLTGTPSSSGWSSSSSPRSSSDQTPISQSNSQASTFSWPHVLPADKGASPLKPNDEAQSRFVAPVPADHGKRPMLYDAGAAHGKDTQTSLHSTGRPGAATTSSGGRDRFAKTIGRGLSAALEGTGAGNPVSAADMALVGPPAKKSSGGFKLGNIPWNKGKSMKGRVTPDGQPIPYTKPGPAKGTVTGKKPWAPGRKAWNDGLIMSQRVGPDGQPIPYKKPGPKLGSKNQRPKNRRPSEKKLGEVRPGSSVDNRGEQ